MEPVAGMSETPSLIANLRSVLQRLHDDKYHSIPNPPSCKKRASVSLVLRIKPTFPSRGSWDVQANSSAAGSFERCLENHFDQSWVQNGDPEVLFIKRAARTGDRWTGHVALPGGKREPGDADDKAAGIRETREEVGLELDAEHCLFIGNLPERVITTNWGKVPIMVLCPFVYLLLRHDIPPLVLQPGEIHSTHWVPIRGLLSPSLRSSERADVSDRLKMQRGPMIKTLTRAAIGQLIFSSTILTPSESLFCSSAPGFIPSSSAHTISGMLGSLVWQKQLPRGEARYSLWGLTLGVIADLLHQIDPQATSTLWSWPTFSHWDIHVIVWVLTYKLRTNKSREINQQGSGDKKEHTALEMNGIDNTTFTVSPKQRVPEWQPSLAAAHMLDEYFSLMRRAVVYAFVLRVNAIAVVVASIILRYRRRGFKL